MTVNILGQEYEIIIKKYDEDEAFKRRSINGYADTYIKQLIICDMHTFPDWEYEPEETIKECQKETIRHEIVHAFLDESGLSCSALQTDNSWARNEEMVDWIAIQGIKIYKAWQEAQAV